MSYRGKVHNGVVEFEDGATLPEGAVVKVERIATAPEAGASDGWANELLKVAGTAKGLPPDLARTHDLDLHDQPKR